MAKIRNTAIPNNYGDGYKQEVIMDDNTTYKIENTPIPNNYGEGYKQEIYEVPTSNESSSINTSSTWLLYAFFYTFIFSMDCSDYFSNSFSC